MSINRSCNARAAGPTSELQEVLLPEPRDTRRNCVSFSKRAVEKEMFPIVTLGRAEEDMYLV